LSSKRSRIRSFSTASSQKAALIRRGTSMELEIAKDTIELPGERIWMVSVPRQFYLLLTLAGGTG
jgi:hypothetical protein